MLWLIRHVKDNRGQTLVEFALILPVLLLLVVGMMDFGLILNQQMIMAEAAREGARSAALGGNNGTVTTVARTAAGAIDIAQLTVTITPDLRIRGEAVTVRVTNPVRITQLVRPFLPDGFVVQGTATMRVE
ncbi:MAG: pilus assembly protein [Sporomusaceae bacterium]|nr:pilus assembly protein [Sporomusaceae bacterium]